MFFFKIFNNNYINEVNQNNYAILIQSIWRMYITKKKYNYQKKSALKIQKCYKKYKFRVRRNMYKNKLQELIIIENNINTNNINNKLNKNINLSVDNIINNIIDDTIEIYKNKVVNKVDNNIDNNIDNNKLKNRKVGFSNRIDYINKNYNNILETSNNINLNDSINDSINDTIIDINSYRNDYYNYISNNYNYDYIKKYDNYDNDVNCLSIMKNAIKNISNNLIVLKECFKFDIENNHKNLNRQYYGKKYNYKYGTFVNDYELDYLNKV